MFGKKLQIANCKMQNENFGGRSNRQSAICNLHFAFCNLRRPRSGLSLTEVLIAMGILTLGLLGVASIFPVAGFYMHKAELEDRGSALARSVMNDIVARGMLNPDAWYLMTPVPLAAAPGRPDSRFSWADGKYSPAQGPMAGTFTRPFSRALSSALQQPTASTDRTLIGKQFGSAYVIDPIGVATISLPPTHAQINWNTSASAFPATGYQIFQTGQLYSAQWQPWGYIWPIRRVTFRQPSTGWQMDDTAAKHYFQGNDDLVTELPDRDDRPATQNWDTIAGPNGSTIPVTRQWVGDYSWIVTVVPGTNDARNDMAQNPEGHAYDVSVVVFYKRTLPQDAVSTAQLLGNSTSGGGAADEFFDTVGEGERAVKAQVVSTGLNGGELLLTDLGDNQKRSAFDGLRTSQWIMLCGPHPNSTASEPRFSLNWYQVITVDREGVDGNLPPTQRLVTVRGPEWPWRPGDATSNDLCVAICRGAVAVHSKTIRLENTRGSGGQVAFGDGGNPSLSRRPWD
jgi:hypothetical protein